MNTTPLGIRSESARIPDGYTDTRQIHATTRQESWFQQSQNVAVANARASLAAVKDAAPGAGWLGDDLGLVGQR